MSKEGSSPKLADTAKNTLTFLDRGASMAKDLVTLGLLSAGDFSQPAALVCLLCKGGLIMAEPLRKFLSAGSSAGPSLTPGQIHAFLSGIFAETNTLRRSAVHAGRLIDEAESGQCRIQDLQLDADDPAAPFLALYRAAHSGQQETQAALQQLLDLQTPSATTAVAIPPELLAENHQALIALIADSGREIQAALQTHTATLREDLTRITESLDRVEGKIDEHTGFLKQAADERAEILRLLQQQGRRIEDIPQQEIEAELARRLSLSVETLRARIAAGLKSEDALTRGRAELLAGRRDEAIATANEVKLHHADAIRQLIAAEEIIAEAHFEKVEYELALAALQRIAAFIDRQSEQLAWANAQHSVAYILGKMARHNEAVALLQQVITIKERELGPDATSLATSLNNLAGLLQAQGKLTEAEQLFHRSLEIDEAKLGSNHPDVAASLNNLAELYRNQGRLEEAEPLYLRSLEIAEANLGKDHPNVGRGLNNLALLLEDQGRLAEAEALYRRAVEISESKLGKNHPDVAPALNNLAFLLEGLGKTAEAEVLFLRALEINESKLGKYHPMVATCLNNLAGLLRTQGQLEKAEALFRRALEISEIGLGDEYLDVASSHNNLASLLKAQGKFTEARSLYRRALNIYFLHRKRNGTPHQHEQAAVGNYSLLLKAMDRSPEQIREEIEAVRREAGLEG